MLYTDTDAQTHMPYYATQTHRHRGTHRHRHRHRGTDTDTYAHAVLRAVAAAYRDWTPAAGGGEAGSTY